MKPQYQFKASDFELVQHPSRGMMIVTLILSIPVLFVFIFGFSKSFLPAYILSDYNIFWITVILTAVSLCLIKKYCYKIRFAIGRKGIYTPHSGLISWQDIDRISSASSLTKKTAEILNNSNKNTQLIQGKTFNPMIATVANQSYWAYIYSYWFQPKDSHGEVRTQKPQLTDKNNQSIALPFILNPPLFGANRRMFYQILDEHLKNHPDWKRIRQKAHKTSKNSTLISHITDN